MRKVFTTASLYRTTSSSSRHRGYVGDVAKAQPVHHLSSVTQCWCTVGTVGALRIVIVVSPLPHPTPFSPRLFVSYSADNSWRAISTRSLNVRSRIIWRSTLSTLIHSVDKVERQMMRDRTFKERVEMARQELSAL